MVRKITLIGILICLFMFKINAQDTIVNKLIINAPLIEVPDNFTLPYNYPSMNQAFMFSHSMYELSYWGIDELGNKVFNDESGQKFSNKSFKYLIGLAFAKYGSELPIPLGVWAHEEYHRAVLGTADISSKNGNWLFSRWDGTVYGVSDKEMTDLKSNNLNTLLYAYVSGVQYEINLNKYITVNDFFNKRTHYKNALLLYNAWYVYDYFRFSASDVSDSVKINAPENESINPTERDFAGADLTAWVYDMFNPEAPYTSREAFPDGEGVNRRIGFSDLSEDGKEYLKKQRNLSLLNFLNPSIFFVNRINVSDDFSFTLFTQYSPTHFGNDVAVYLPFMYKNTNWIVSVNSYSNKDNNGMGFGLGIHNLKVTSKLESDLSLNYWNQPESFFTDKKINGGYFKAGARYKVRNNFALEMVLDGKTKGWMIGEPELKSSLAIHAGLQYKLYR